MRTNSRRRRPTTIKQATAFALLLAGSFKATYWIIQVIGLVN